MEKLRFPAGRETSLEIFSDLLSCDMRNLGLLCDEGRGDRTATVLQKVQYTNQPWVIPFNNRENWGTEQWGDFTEVTQGQTLVLANVMTHLTCLLLAMPCEFWISSATLSNTIIFGQSQVTNVSRGFLFFYFFFFFSLITSEQKK